MLRNIVKNLLHKMGFDIVRYPYRGQVIKRRMKLISYYGIDLIFDVGANIGQYVNEMRNLGYKGRIVSFEPLSSAYQELLKYSYNDPIWDAVNIALGDYDGKAKINIANNSYSSSILNMLSSHLNAAPESSFIGQEGIEIRKIDSIIDKYYQSSNRLFIKIDTQGYEENVIKGALNSLDKIVGMQVEMSLVPLYQGECLITDMINWLFKIGFTLMSLEPGFYDSNSGQLFQVDGIFFRKLMK